MVVMDDDFGFGDDVLGVAEIEFATAEFIKKPWLPQKLTLKLMAADQKGNVKDTGVHITSHPTSDLSSILLLMITLLIYMLLHPAGPMSSPPP